MGLTEKLIIHGQPVTSIGLDRQLRAVFQNSTWCVSTPWVVWKFAISKIESCSNITFEWLSRFQSSWLRINVIVIWFGIWSIIRTNQVRDWNCYLPCAKDRSTFRVFPNSKARWSHLASPQTHNVKKRRSLCSTGGIKVLFALARFSLFHKTVKSFRGGRFDQINHIIQSFVLLDLKLATSFGLLFHLVDEPCLTITVSTQKPEGIETGLKRDWISECLIIIRPRFELPSIQNSLWKW